MSLTIVMYHYVRDVERTPFPGIHALRAVSFRTQLDYFSREFEIVGVDEVIAAVKDPRISLPPNAVWLTFDDGYRDHIENVLPPLVEREMKASFFPIGRTVAERDGTRRQQDPIHPRRGT